MSHAAAARRAVHAMRRAAGARSLLRLVVVAIWSCAALAGAPMAASAQIRIDTLSPPVGAGAREPMLASLGEGRLLISWTEPDARGFAVRMAILDEGGWSEPRTVTASDRLFVNWADFAGVTALADGTLAAHWLMQSGTSFYDYDIAIAFSGDEGRSWGPALTPHRSDSTGQQGFVALLPIAPDRLMAFWLDGRAYGGTGSKATGDAMQLRMAEVGTDGRMGEEVLLDAFGCSCCQTSAAMSGDGTALVAYRDRTIGEIRDISVMRLPAGKAWSDPATVRRDGWEIPGCPVNGPAIDARGQRAAVAWFTAADDIPAVRVAFSDDAGARFGDAVRIDGGEPVGRVDLVLLADGTGLVSWVEWTEAGEAIRVCRTRPGTGCAAPLTVAVNRKADTVNFPRMVAGRDGVYLAWTQPLGSDLPPDRASTVRLVRLRP